MIKRTKMRIRKGIDTDFLKNMKKSIKEAQERRLSPPAPAVDSSELRDRKLKN